MEIENSSYGRDSDQAIRSKENGSAQNDHVNGLSNGYSDKHKSHKSEHKDKHRDKDRERDRDKSKSHKSSSSSKDKHSSSSSKDKERDRERDKDKHSSSHKSSSRDKERSDKDRSDRDKSDKDRSEKRDKKDRDRDEKKSSSSSKEHKSSSRDKDRDKERDRDREKDRDKEKSRDKERSKDKDRERDRDKDRHKDRNSSSSKDKHRDKDREKSSRDKDRSHSSSKDKDKEKHRSEKSNEKNHYNTKAEIKQEIKEEPDYDQEVTQDSVHEELNIKDEYDEDSQEEQNVSQASSCDYNLSSFKTDQEDDADEEYDEPEAEPEQEEDEDDDAPLLSRKESHKKRKIESGEEDEDDDIPLAARKKQKTEKKKKRAASSESEDEKPLKKAKKKKIKKEVEVKREEETSPKKKKKKEDEEQEVWKWWEEEKKDDGTKWNFLEHKGPVFAPPYEKLPDNVKFYYDGRELKLSQDAEEVAGFYAKMLDHDYTTKDIFNNNFFKDWRKSMTEKERSLITDLKKCNFKPMHTYFMDLAEKNRNRTKEEKKALKEKNDEILKEYGFCTIDGHKEKIGNFKIEPPGLFRGRGEHPKMGMLKRRVMPEDVMINCSKKSKIPEPPPGHKWKEVRHDPTVTWLASWTENVQNQVKYVMLNPSSKLKGEKDWQKYETARKLHKNIDQIRKTYKEDWKSKEMRIRQRAVALYFIDKLALRAGNEKDEDQADTVGCCSLRIEHIELHEEKDDREYVVVFDFLGKDSIRYYNEVPVEKRVFKNLQLFMENKAPGDDLFDRLNTQIMNKHLNELMEGLTAKVFRTYNASHTLQEQLDKLTNGDDSVTEKILSYNRANRAVAILCNHQRSVPKGHQKSMEKLKEKIDQKREQIDEMQKQVKDAARDAKHGSVKEKIVHEKKKKALDRLKDQLKKLEVQETDRDENKSIALGTSKLNYLDPRISVAWCKKYDVPIEKIYNKTQRDKFRWAIDMAGPDYRF